MIKPLPPTLQMIINDYKLPPVMLPALLRLMTEACRLQQEAELVFARGQGAQMPREQAELVVPSIVEELR